MKNKYIVGAVALAIIASGTKPYEKQPVGVHATPPEPKTETLRIYNWEDYIYEPETSADEPSVIRQFQDYYATLHPNTKVNVVYDTFATNEEMLNQVTKLGKTYDLMCPSDYAIQKLIREDKLEEYDYNSLSQTYTSIDNYNEYATPYLTGLFEEEGWSKYAVGYMWGTMGLVYNPAKVDEADMETWMSLYETKYKNKSSIKDSMRDTYLVGVISAYRQELTEARVRYELGADSKEVYKAKLEEIINRCDKRTLEKVEFELKTLTKNVYGLEVDSGKNDIAKGIIDINLAWSGDAVYAMEVADEVDLELKYSIPKEGSNIWYDGWVMPKGANKELAQEFLNFISQPEIAVLNMNYIGYTSFIAGEEVLDNIRENYEETDENAEDVISVDLSYYFNGTVEPGTDMIVKSSETNRQFYAQYPDEESINRCAIMRDFGAENENVVAMWTRVRSNGVSSWVYIIFGVFVLGIFGFVVFNDIKKKSEKKRRRSRQNR